MTGPRLHFPQYDPAMSVRPTKKWLLIPVVYLVGSAVVGTYVANRRKP